MMSGVTSVVVAFGLFLRKGSIIIFFVPFISKHEKKNNSPTLPSTYANIFFRKVFNVLPDIFRFILLWCEVL